MCDAPTGDSGLGNRKNFSMGKGPALVYHVNLRKRPIAAQRLSDNLHALNVHDAIVSINETTKFISNIETFNPPLFSQCSGRETRAAVYIKGDRFKGILVAHLSTPDVAVVDITSSNLNFVLISAYLPPNKDYKRALEELEIALRNIAPDKKILVCSDTNSRSTFWGDRETNDRGRMFEHFLAINETTILNSKGTVTFENKNGESVIDLILANSNLLNNHPTVKVLTETLTSSDHRMLEINIETENLARENNVKPTTRKYQTKKTNVTVFNENLEAFSPIIDDTNFEVSSPEEADLAVKRLNEYLERVCESAIPPLKPAAKKRTNSNEEIENLTKAEEKLNDRYHKLKDINPFEAERVRKELNETTKRKSDEIAKHRRESMNRQFKSADPREAYKIHKAFKARMDRGCPSTIEDLNGNMTKDSHETTKRLFEHSFPNKKHPKLQKKINNQDSRQPVLITVDEVSSIVNKMANNKAPGPDGFTPEIIKRALPKIVTPLTQLYNSLLKIGYFPDCWKEGFAIFIPKGKPDKKIKTVKDFRPITLLNVLAKIFESLLTIRINKYLHSNKKMNKNQNGFNKQKSTINSLNSLRNFILRNRKKRRSTIAIFLDISGAFDNACWQLIVESLKNKDCPVYLTNLIISYFQNRTVTTNSHSSKLKKNLTQGAPQGSCCGPSLWNILLDNIFEIAGIKEKLNLDNFYIKAFADDVCIAFAVDDFIRCDENLKAFEKMISSTLDSIHRWGKENYLDFNVKKTQAVFFKASRFSVPPKIFMNKEEIPLSKSAKYLGIWFDEDLTFEEHGLKTIDKCKKIFNIVRGYCGRTWGLDPNLTRLIYRTIVIPVLTYGSSTWYPALRDNSLCKKLRTLQYYGTKSITKSYRTASIVSTSLLSNTLPLEAEVFMRAQIELARETGAIQADILGNALLRSDNYKPDYLFDDLLDVFEDKENLITIEDADNFVFGSPDDPWIEPRIRWADLPIGSNKMPIKIESDYMETTSDFFIFTDGSSRIDFGTGCSFIVKTNTETIESILFPMNPFCTNFQSEEFAIYRSLDWALKNLDVTNKKLTICTDSLSALQKLKKNENDTLLPFLINDALKKLARFECEVVFAKVPAHQEERLAELDENARERFFIIGNIEADHLAKVASFLSQNHEQLEIELPFNFVSLSTVKRYIRNQMKLSWLTRAFDPKFKDDRAELNNWIKNFIPNARFVTERLVILCDYFTTQVVIGHGCFMVYFKRFKLAKSDKCILCKDKVDTPEHVLFDCVGKYRETLKKMKIFKATDLYKVLSSEENIVAFKELCKLVVAERSELINSSSEMLNNINGPKKGEVGNTSEDKKPKDNRILFSQQEFEKKENEETNSRVKETTIGKTRPKSGGYTPVKAKPVDQNEVYDISIKHKVSSSNWLGDEHIYEFTKKIQTALNKFNHLIMPSTIYLNLDGSRRQTAGFLRNYVSTYTKNILVIIHDSGNHWISGAVNLDSKTIAIFDSMRKLNHSEHFAKLFAIASLALTCLGRSCKIEEFNFYLAFDNPKQENSNDCGLFTARTIKSILEGDSRKFSIKTGEYRKELVEILDNETQVREPPASNISSFEIDIQMTCDALWNQIASLKPIPAHMSFSDLVEKFF